jgi:hypothetical protein
MWLRKSRTRKFTKLKRKANMSTLKLKPKRKHLSTQLRNKNMLLPLNNPLQNLQLPHLRPQKRLLTSRDLGQKLEFP